MTDQPPSDMGLRVLLGSGLALREGRILRASWDGALLEFPRAAAPDLCVGEPADLHFLDPGGDELPVLCARIVETIDDAGVRRIRASYDVPGAFADSVVPALARLFGRRASRRIELREHVAVVMASGGAARSIRGRLSDLSDGGASLMIEGSMETLFARTTQVELVFRLPSDEEPFYLLGSIHRRALLDEGLLYVVEFDSGRSEDFEGQQRRLRAYITTYGTTKAT